MKTNIATTLEQSARLLRCGVSADTADMCYDNGALSLLDYDSAVHERDSRRETYELTPAWTLSALLGLLPKELEYFPFTKWYVPFQDGWDIGNKENMSYINGEVQLYFSEGIWIVDYDWDGFDGQLPQSDNPIEACVLAIELLVANGYNLTR